MKPQNQSRPHTKELPGDCLRACIATMLEIKLDDIPDFITFRDREGDMYPAWYLELQSFLCDKGFAFVEIELTSHVKWNPLPYDTMCIFFGYTEQGIKHAIVGKCDGKEMVPLFDPSIIDGAPGETTITQLTGIGLLVPRDPVMQVKFGKAIENIEHLASKIKNPIAETIRDISRDALGKPVFGEEVVLTQDFKLNGRSIKKGGE